MLAFKKTPYEVHKTMAVLKNLVPQNETYMVADYFEDMDIVAKLKDEFDVVVYEIAAMPKYYLGIAAAQAYMALKIDGKFVIDINGFVGDMNSVIAVIEYLGFVLSYNDDGIFIFIKEVDA